MEQEKKIYESYIQCPISLKKLTMKSINTFSKIPYCGNCDANYKVTINDDMKIIIKEK